MPEFIYTAKNGPTEIVRGRIISPNKQDAVRMIEAEGLMPIEVSLAASAPPPSSPQVLGGDQAVKTPKPKESTRPFGRSLSLYEVCIFARQLSSFMRSHVSLLSALEFIYNETPAASKMKPILKGITEDVRDGMRFSDALEGRGSLNFDARFISMIRSGESAGHLEEILETLANSLETEEELRGQVRSALAYPILVLTAGAATVFFLLTFAIPRLSSLFGQNFKTLPLATKILLALAKPEWQAFIIGVFALLVCVVLFFVFGKGANKKWMDRMTLKLPILGTLRLKADIARFCGALGMLVESGVPIYQAIEVTRPVLGNEVLKEDLKDAQSRVLGGEMFASILREIPSFPPFVSQMVAVGEDSGQLANSLREVSRFYARESLRGIKAVTSLIEPLLILSLSLVVGFIVAGIMLPIFNMDWVK